jgi:hypothetical protein
MKKLFFILTSFSLSLAGLAQSCLPEGITFTTQAQIDSFQVNYPGCTEIQGNVVIAGGTSIMNLNGLSNLSSILGKVSIFNCPVLSNLHGLEGLTYIGGNLEIGDCFSTGLGLTSLEGLDGLTNIDGALRFLGIRFLTSMTGLQNLISTGGGIEIQGVPLITDLTGLESLSSIGGDLFIVLNDSLLNLNGLNHLISIEGSLHVEDNFMLTNLDGIDSLTTIDQGLKIMTNPALINLDGLHNLNHIGENILIEWNDNLENLTGLESVNYVGKSIRIFMNPELISLAGLDNIEAASIDNLEIRSNGLLSDCNTQSICDYLSSPTGIIDIYENAEGCNNPAEIANNCGIILPCLPFGNYHFPTQSDVDNFSINYPDCEELDGNVLIHGPDITNVDGLNSITSIGGSLNFKYNYNLTNLDGLENLRYIGGSLELGWWEYNNASLENLDGLLGLDSIGGHLDIFYETSLKSLEGLENVTSIGGNIQILLNDSLTSLKGIDNIDAATIQNIHIAENPLLSTCEVQSVCDYLANPNGTIEINDNASGCNSQAEVEAACEVGLNEIPTKNQFTICPNPSSTQITIETSAVPTKFQISIFNLNGQEVIHQQIKEPRTVIDISYLPGGVYFVRMTGERSVSVEKFVKID